MSRSQLGNGLQATLAGLAATIAIAATASLLPWQSPHGTRVFVHLSGDETGGLAVVDDVWWWWGRMLTVDSEATILSGFVPWDPQDPLRIAGFVSSSRRLDTDAPGWRERALASKSTTSSAKAWRRDAFGFPFVALGETWCETASGAIELEGGFDLRDASSAARQTLHGIPWTPQWMGFALDVAIFAGLCAGMRLLVSSTIARRRRRTGRCTRCAHPLAGAERCPECGASVSA